MIIANLHVPEVLYRKRNTASTFCERYRRIRDESNSIPNFTQQKLVFNFNTLWK